MSRPLVAESDPRLGFGLTALTKSRRRVASAAALLLIVVAAIVALVLVTAFEQQLRDVIDADDLHRQGRELTLGLTQAENAQRGFLLTQDEAYLRSYEASLDAIEDRLLGLEMLLADEPVRLDDLAALRDSIESRLTELRRAVELVRDGSTADAAAVVGSNEGQSLMADISGRIDGLMAVEDQQLAIRNDAVESTRQGLLVVILSALAGAAFLAYLLFSRSQRRVSDLAQRQAALKTLNAELESRVRERTAELEQARQHADRERERVETLLQDANHRIGNSLATVSSLLTLQQLRTEAEDVKAALDAARGRVHTIASAHRRLRLGGDLESARADEFLTSVMSDLKTNLGSSGRVAVETDFAPIVIAARDATTLGILLGELVTNAFKHAFPGDCKGTVWTSLQRDDAGVLCLEVADDGCGMTEFGPSRSGGLGSSLVFQLARQFRGEPHLQPRTGGGTRVVVTLPGLGT